MRAPVSIPESILTECLHPEWVFLEAIEVHNCERVRCLFITPGSGRAYTVERREFHRARIQTGCLGTFDPWSA
jgi:hypothetical protein